MALPKLVVFDLTDTLVKDNSWAALHTAFGMTPEEDRFLYNLNQEGIVTNELWLQIVNNLYKTRGMATRANAEEAVSNFTFIDGARECVSKLQSAGVQVAVLSGSFDLFVDRVAKELGVNLTRSGGSLVFDQNGKFVKMDYLDEEVLAKVHNFKALCKEAGVKASEAVCVGDGSNEKELFKVVRGITFTNSKVTDLAWKVVPSIHEVADAILAD